jgi:tRNA(adenine34) deaminase
MDQKSIDILNMQQALLLAESAAEKAEVPVGALITLDNDIVGKGENCPIRSNDPSAHAEIIALRNAAENLQNYRIPRTTLYVTLEPCIMCMGAIIHARVERVVFGAYDPKTGAAGSLYSIGKDNLLNHHIEITGGILKDECSKLLKNFFRTRRKKIRADFK